VGGKGGRCVRLTTLPPSCADVMKSGNLNFLEPSGPLQASNGTDLPLLSSGGYLRFTSDSGREKTHHTPLSHHNLKHQSNQCSKFTSHHFLTAIDKQTQLRAGRSGV